MSTSSLPNQPNEYIFFYPKEPGSVPINENLSKEQEIQLSGSDKTIRIRILSSTPMSEQQFKESVQGNLDSISKIVDELKTPVENITIEILSSGQIRSIHLRGEPDSQDKSKINSLVERVNKKFVVEAMHLSDEQKKLVSGVETELTGLNYRHKLELSEQKINEIAIKIILEGPKAIKMAQTQKRKVLLDDSNVQIVASRKGKLFIKVSFLGKGEYKDTFKFANIDSIIENSTRALQQSQVKLRALGIPRESKENRPMNPKLAEVIALEHKNEIALHRELKEVQKKARLQGIEDPFSNIATSSLVTHVKATGNQAVPGEALMGRFYNGGDVDKLIKDNSLTLEQRAFICAGCLRGIAQLHSKDIVHRDIKADNLLIEAKESVVPKNQWPLGVSPGNIPKGYTASANRDFVTELRKREITKAVVADLGKGSHLKEDLRFEPGSFLFYVGIVPPGKMTEGVAFSTEFDVYSAGRTAYQIFAGVPLGSLRSVNPDDPDRDAIEDKIFAAQKELRTQTDPAKSQALSDKLDKLHAELMDWDIIKLGPPESWLNWQSIPPRIQTFIEKMVDPNPKLRPTAADGAAFFEALTSTDLKMGAPSANVTPEQLTIDHYSLREADTSSDKESHGYSAYSLDENLD